MNNDDDLRRLFADATSEIRPHGTLEDIRNQTTKVDPMARRWFLPSLAAAAVMTLVIGGAFWMTRDGDDAPSPNIATSPSGAPTAPSTPVDPSPVTVYYVGEGAQGPRLFAEEHETANGDTAAGAANLAATGSPTDPDYKTYWPADVEITGVSMVDLDTEYLAVQLTRAVPERPAGVTAAQATRQVQAVVRSAQTALASFYENGQDIPPVEFFVDGTRQESVLGVTGPDFTPGNDDDVLALVSISDLADGAIVQAGKLTVKGMAAAFEANVSWEILVGGDAVIDSGYATATECCTLSPYEFTTTIALEGPGTYTLVVHDNDESGEGRPVNQDSKEIVVE